MTRQELFTLTAATLASGIAILDGSVVTIALPSIAATFHTDYSALQWIIDGYLLSLSAMILFAGSLGDIFGHRKLFQIGILGFGLSSLACGLAPGPLSLTLARLAQGFFGALLTPTSLAIINTTFPKERRTVAISQWTAYGAIAAAVGPLLGGLLIAASWRWIFIINLPLVAVCLYFIRQGLPHTPTVVSRTAKIDIIGGILGFIGLAGVTYGLIEGPSHGWHAATISIMLVGIISLGSFIGYERRADQPMLPFSLFNSRNFSGANIATLGMYAALGGITFTVTLYLQTALNFTPLAASLVFLPVTFFMIFLSGRIGKLSTIYGPRRFMTAGPLISAAGFLLFLRVSPAHHNYVTDILPGVILFGLGLAIIVAPLTATVMASIKERYSGIGSAFNNAAARLASLLMIAFLGVIVANVTTHNLKMTGQDTRDNQLLISSAIASNRPATKLTDIVTKTKRDSYELSLITEAALAALAGVSAFIFIRTPKD